MQAELVLMGRAWADMRRVYVVAEGSALGVAASPTP
jgi:hypothetical protein